MSIKKLLLGAVASLMLVSCGTTSTVPITGRQHTLLYDDGQILSLSKQQYSEVIQKSTLSKDATKTALVKRVGEKLAKAVESYLKENGAANDLQYYEWEFNLVKSDEVNAFCMPGGKIGVYEGILPVTQDEAGLAIVLGHEIAHAVAKHSAEQMSKQARQQQAVQIGGALLGMAGASQQTTSIANMASQLWLATIQTRLLSSGNVWLPSQLLTRARFSATIQVTQSVLPLFSRLFQRL